MKHLVVMALALISVGIAGAQTIYVDAQKGNNSAPGTFASPLKSLQKAVEVARDFSGTEPVTINLAPGLYELDDRLLLQTKNNGNDAARYTLEADVMPDSSLWKPAMMPIVQSVAGNNDHAYFDHCTGVLADRANVSIRGIKFLGNSNPGVDYYYPIEKDTTTLNDIEISQCYFIGDRYGAVIQGAVYVEGPGIHVDHCIFYGCKNAVLCFQNLSDFSLTHSIIYGAYECAIWYGEFFGKGPENDFNFDDNIISHCRYFWAASNGKDHSYYHFKHSLISDNEHYVGMQDGNGGVMPLPKKETYFESDIRKIGSVKLIEVETGALPHNYLHLESFSDGNDIRAGIFMGASK